LTQEPDHLIDSPTCGWGFHTRHALPGSAIHAPG
jgi:hypothetical protein